MELSIFELSESDRYPVGIKYGLVFHDLETEKFLLFDNHHPKGPHVHINDLEFGYKYVSDEKLIEDFSELVFQEFGVKL